MENVEQKLLYNEGTELEYSLQKTEKHDTLYVANCIEDGDKFGTDFYAPSTYSKSQLKEIGKELASDWGGECLSVKRELTEQEKFERDSKKWKYLCGTKYGRKFRGTDEEYTLVGFKGKRTLIIAKDLNSDTRYEMTLPKRVPDYVLPTFPWV